MTTPNTVMVKKLPQGITGSQAKELFDEVMQLLQDDRPSLVLDFSQVARIDSAGIDVLLGCTEEAMKRNGDIKLAAVSPEVAAILELTRVDRLFQVFETPSEAVESFRRFPGRTPVARPGEGNAAQRSDGGGRHAE